MTGEIVLTGIVLGSQPVGEYDRRLSMLTCERGRISAFARGARKPMSSLRAVSRLFTFAKFSLYAGRDSYSVSKCENPVFFDEIIMDPEKTYYAMYFCELMEYFTRENADEKEQVKLLYSAFRALIKDVIPLNLLRRIFELRAIANFGEMPNVFECSVCGKKEDETEWLFDIRQGRILCKKCLENHAVSTGDELQRVIPETVRYAMHYCITVPYKKLFAFGLSPEVYSVFEEVTDIYMKSKVDRPLKTLELLDGMKI